MFCMVYTLGWCIPYLAIYPKGEKMVTGTLKFSWNISHMEGFALVMCIGAVIGTSLVIWFNTKSGQNGLIVYKSLETEI